jgi:hypothetical protein
VGNLSVATKIEYKFTVTRRASVGRFPACGKTWRAKCTRTVRERTGCMEIPRDVARYDAVTMVHLHVDLVLLKVRVDSSTKENESGTHRRTRQCARQETSPSEPTNSTPSYLDDRSPSAAAGCLWKSAKNGKRRSAAVELLTRRHHSCMYSKL